MGDPRHTLRTDQIEWRAIEGEIVALDLRSSVYLAINQTGAVLWPDLASGATREQLVQRLVDRCGIEPSQAAGDVDEFIVSLAALDLLESP